MSSRFLRLLLGAALLGAPLVAGAEPVARVNGQEIDRDWVRLYAQRFYSDQVKDGVPSATAWEEALQKVVTNRALFLKAQTEDPSLVAAVTRAADLALARDYYQPYLKEIAAPIAAQRVTVETLLPRIPEQEDVALVAQIVMADREALEALRKRLVAGELAFDEAARKLSIGLSAVKGGDLGAITRHDSRYAEEVLDVVFSTPEGEITPVVADLIPGRYSILRVRDVTTAEEARRIQAEGGLETYRDAERVKIAWEEVERYEAEKRSELFLKKDIIGQATPEGTRPVFQVDGVTYTVADVLSRSGGLQHGNKDILTIAENCYRDLILEAVYLARQGTRRAEAHLERDVMREHYLARRYLARESADLEVSDAEVDAYLAENQKKYALPNRAELGMIFVQTEERLKQVQQRLAEGVDFETVAKGWSQDERTAAVGGRVGIVALAGMKGNPSEFQPGTVTQPSHVAEGEAKGYYLFKVHKLFPAEPGTRESLGPKVVGGIRSIILARKKEERLGKAVAAVLSQSKVELLKTGQEGSTDTSSTQNAKGAREP